MAVAAGHSLTLNHLGKCRLKTATYLMTDH